MNTLPDGRFSGRSLNKLSTHLWARMKQRLPLKLCGCRARMAQHLQRESAMIIGYSGLGVLVVPVLGIIDEVVLQA